jgi:hypothetical protein
MKRAAIALLFGMCAVVAQAGPIPVLIDVTPFGGDFNWNYRIDIGVDENLVSGNFFTIYDFPSVTATNAPSGWTSSLQNIGITPPRVLPTDSATVSNVTFTYTGPAIGGPATLSTFTVRSAADGAPVSTQFTSVGQKNNGPLSGTTVETIGLVGRPSSSGEFLEPIPEPGTITLVGLALLALPILRRR